MSNTGFVDIDTAPVTQAPVTIRDLGTFSPLAGPTITPDGTVVVGTLEGKVIALHPDGRPFWNRQLPGHRGIDASPAVGSDGSVYVVGSWVAMDHRGGGPPRKVGYAELNRFTPGGGAPQTGVTPFPEFDRGGPTLIGAPKVWRFGNDEAIIVPALYPTVGGFDQHLLAFSPNGGVMADWKQYLSGGDVEEEGGVFETLLTTLFPPFHPGHFGPMATAYPGVTISDGTPFVVLIDRYFRKIITFTFCVGPSCSPAPGFVERLRTSATHELWSSGTVAPETNHTVVGTNEGVVFGGPSAVTTAPVEGLPGVYATPTVAADGRIVIVTIQGEVIGLRGRTIVSRVDLQESTVARAAASRNYVYVATAKALHTLDAEADATVATFQLEGGGIWSPAIGPDRHIYTIAANELCIFPPMRRLPRPPRGEDAGGLGSTPETG